MFKWNCLCFGLCLFPRVLSLGTPEKNLAPSSLLSPLAYGQLVIHWGSQVFLCKAVFPGSWPPTCTGTKGEGGLNKKGGKRENDKEKGVGAGFGGWDCAEECRQLEPVCWLQQASLPQPRYNTIGGRPQS